MPQTPSPIRIGIITSCMSFIIIGPCGCCSGVAITGCCGVGTDGEGFVLYTWGVSGGRGFSTGVL